jgi:uncharacterized protein YkwD
MPAHHASSVKLHRNPRPPHPPPPHDGPPGVSALDASPLLTRLNTLRQQHGLAVLHPNPALNLSARKHADYMAATGNYGHDVGGLTSQQRIEQAGYSPAWTALGENIAYNFGYPNPVQQLFVQWENSPEHLANMLFPSFRDVGIAVASGRGTVYGVMDFGAA